MAAFIKTRNGKKVSIRLHDIYKIALQLVLQHKKKSVYFQFKIKIPKRKILLQGEIAFHDREKSLTHKWTSQIIISFVYSGELG